MTANCIHVEYDEKRCGWWFRGMGFDFMAYFTIGGDPLAEDFDACPGFLEADVQREGEPYEAHVTIPLPTSGIMTEDLFATAALKQLRRFWLLPPVVDWGGVMILVEAP